MKNLEQAPPRFKGCPPICLKANLPAFETVKAAKDWHESHCPGVKIKEPKACEACDGYHCDAQEPDTGRMTAKQMRHNGDMSDQSLREFRLAAVVAPEKDLPKQKAPTPDPVKAKPKVARKSLQPSGTNLF